MSSTSFQHLIQTENAESLKEGGKSAFLSSQGESRRARLNCATRLSLFEKHIKHKSVQINEEECLLKLVKLSERKRQRTQKACVYPFCMFLFTSREAFKLLNSLSQQNSVS